MTGRPGNVHNTSLTVAIGSEVLCMTTDSARQADYCAVIMDDTTDLAHTQQINNFNAFELVFWSHGIMKNYITVCSTN